MRIENISLRLNLVSSSLRGHKKRTKKIKRGKEREKKKKKNWRTTASIAVRSLGERKKWRKRGQSRRKLKPFDFNNFSFSFFLNLGPFFWGGLQASV